MVALNNIINSLPNLVFWKDEHLIYRGCNDKALEMMGLEKKEELLGKIDSELPWKESYRVQFTQYDLEVITTGKSKLKIAEVIATKDGRVLEVLTDRIALYDAGNKFAGILVISSESSHLNLSDRVFFHHILEHLPYYMFWKNKDSIYLGSNSNFSKLVGLDSQKDLLGKTDMDLNWGKGEAEFYMEADHRVMQGTEQVNVEEILKRPDGSEIIMMVSKIPVKNSENDVVGVLGISTDISKIKHVENELIIAKEAEVANIAKNEFIQNMSHDIRTPFTGIVEMAKYIMSREDDEDKTKELGYIIESSEKLLLLLNDIIDIAETENGKYPITFAPFDLKKTIQNVISMMITIIKRKQFQINIDIPASFPSKIISDEFRIDRIILNLLSNAIKFTPKKGSISILVSHGTQKKGKMDVKISIKDSGIGIPTDKLEFIFEKFGRISSSHKGVYSGAGLGLVIVKHLLSDVGGTINVQSKLGAGSLFECTIPVMITNNRKYAI